MDLVMEPFLFSIQTANLEALPADRLNGGFGKDVKCRCGNIIENRDPSLTVLQLNARKNVFQNAFLMLLPRVSFIPE